VKVVIGPINIASQPYFLARGLRKYGVDATCLTYGNSLFGYESDLRFDISGNQTEKINTFSKAIEETLKHDFDIYHFFQRSFVMAIPPKNHDGLTGFDILPLKLRGKHIAYRFTGWELIDRELEMANNKYSAFNYGWNGHFNPHLKKEYLEYLRALCDVFMVVDPMMQEHCPEAKIVPRVLRVDDFPHIGIKNTRKPIVLHAPTNVLYKGSKFVMQVLNELKEEGLEFKLVTLNKVPFNEALEWYKKADIIVDQVLIGWYGVLATECMAMGKPVAVYMREDLANTPDEIPVHNINLGNIKDRLRELISNFDLRLSLAERSREYVKSVHDESVVIPKLINVYKNMLEHEPCKPKSNADIEFLRLQLQEVVNLQSKVNLYEKTVKFSTGQQLLIILKHTLRNLREKFRKKYSISQ